MYNDYSKYSMDYVLNNPDQDYTIDWNEIDILVQEQILKYADLDYEKYLPLLKDKSLLYAFNKKILNNLNWDLLTLKEKNYICRNANFDYDKYWHKLDNNQKYVICSKNKNFNYKKYWDILDEECRTIIIKINDDFNFLKYWDDLSLNQCFLAFLKTKHIEEYQEDKLLQYFKNTRNSFDQLIDFDVVEIVKIKFIEKEISIQKIKLLDLDFNIRQFIIKLLKNIHIIPLVNESDLIRTIHSNRISDHITRYNDLYIYDGILIDDFKFVLREEKLKRIFNI